MVVDETFQKQTLDAGFVKFVQSDYTIYFSLYFNKNDSEPDKKTERILNNCISRNFF